MHASLTQRLPVTLINLVYRWQGFMTAPGNPKGIAGIGDLARPEVTFVNRQAGSGTRILPGLRAGQGRNRSGVRGRIPERGIHPHERGRGLG